jgi:hypothetical protein
MISNKSRDFGTYTLDFLKINKNLIETQYYLVFFFSSLMIKNFFKLIYHFFSIIIFTRNFEIQIQFLFYIIKKT